MKLINTLLFFTVTCLFAISCGGGGGGGSSSNPSNIRSSFKANDLYKAQAGDRVVVTELGNTNSAEATVLDQTLIESTDSVTIELNPDNDYVLAIYSFDMPAWRTVILSSQLQSALNSNGELDLGELNALTTFTTGVIEVELNQSRSKVNYKARAKTVTENRLSEWYGSSVTSMADLSYGFEFTETTDQFYAWKNRMQLLMVYLEIVGGFGDSPETSEISAMQELYSSIFDADSTTNLISKLSSPALPDYPVDGQSIVQKLSDASFLFNEDGILTSDELYDVFFKPSESAGLLLKVVEPPRSKMIGSMTGAEKAGIVITASHEEYSSLETVVTTEDDGSFEFTHLVSGNWTLKPNVSDYVFNPPSMKVTLGASESLEGFDFTSFTFGSNLVPEPQYVLAGVTYTSSSGNESLEGEIVSQSVSSTNPVLNAGYYASTNLQEVATNLVSENIKDGISIFGVEGTADTGTVQKTIPAHQESSSSNGSIIVRH